MSDVSDRLNSALEGRYRIEREQGEGGMATVYLADDLRHERKVAVKVLRPDLAAVVGAERFLAEIKTTANLQHPHILPLFDSGEAGGFLFYVMPYVAGETLRDRLDREKQLPVDESIGIVNAVAHALDYAHRHGVIHRDIKPANILLHDGQPVVSDFGIALAVGAAGGNRLTETGLSVGTPYYMSPEQATGDQQVGPASDTYALACVLYEMLTGDPPYMGSTAQAVLGQIIAGDPVSATKKRRSIPAHVDAAIRRALEKLPADRFTSAQDFAKALADGGFRHGEAGPAGPGTAGAARRWRRVALASGMLAAAASALAVWALARPGSPLPVSRYGIALPADRPLAQGTAMTRLALAPGGERWVYQGTDSLGARRLYLRPRDRLDATAIPGSERAGNASFSPDGSRLAFVSTLSGVRRLMVTTLGGGSPLPVEDSLVDNGGVSWGHDGYIYYDGHLEGDGLARVPEGGGTPEPVTMPRADEGELWHFQPRALPNGAGVLFVVSRGSAYDVAVVDLSTGEHRVLVPGALAPRFSPTGHLLYVTEQGALVAAPFDPDGLTLAGDPVALFDGVQDFGLGRVDLELSLDGTLMYVSGGSGGLWEMVWVDREGVATEVDPSWAPGNYSQPALSPDGRQLALTVTSTEVDQLWIKPVDGGPPRRLTFEGTNSFPTWSPDGRSVVFRSIRGGQPPSILGRPADGSAPALPLLVSERGGATMVDYSADGQWLLYVDRGDLRALPLDAAGRPRGEPVALTSTPATELVPALSPDGRWLAYRSDEGGQDEVFVCPFPACDVKYLVSTERGGAYPVWSHSGRELFYRSADGPLMAVEILPGETFTPGRVTALFDASGLRVGGNVGTYDVSGDDRRFVFARRAGGSATDELVVIENFFEILRERVPN